MEEITILKAVNKFTNLPSLLNPKPPVRNYYQNQKISFQQWSKTEPIEAEVRPGGATKFFPDLEEKTIINRLIRVTQQLHSRVLPTQQRRADLLSLPMGCEQQLYKASSFCGWQGEMPDKFQNLPLATKMCRQKALRARNPVPLPQIPQGQGWLSWLQRNPKRRQNQTSRY